MCIHHLSWSLSTVRQKLETHLETLLRLDITKKKIIETRMDNIVRGKLKLKNASAMKVSSKNHKKKKSKKSKKKSK
jgi:hypothetical protein